MDLVYRHWKAGDRVRVKRASLGTDFPSEELEGTIVEVCPERGGCLVRPDGDLFEGRSFGWGFSELEWRDRPPRTRFEREYLF